GGAAAARPGRGHRRRRGRPGVRARPAPVLRTRAGRGERGRGRPPRRPDGPDRGAAGLGRRDRLRHPAARRAAAGAVVTYLLVPGVGGSAWSGHRVAALLRDRGRPVVAVELPADDTAGHLVALSQPEALAGRLEEYRVAAVRERARG